MFITRSSSSDWTSIRTTFLERGKKKQIKDIQTKTEEKQTSPPAGFCYMVTLFSLWVSSVQLRHTDSNTDLYLLKQVALNQDIKQVLFTSSSQSVHHFPLWAFREVTLPDGLIHWFHFDKAMMSCCISQHIRSIVKEQKMLYVWCFTVCYSLQCCKLTHAESMCWFCGAVLVVWDVCTLVTSM